MLFRFVIKLRNPLLISSHSFIDVSTEYVDSVTESKKAKQQFAWKEISLRSHIFVQISRMVAIEVHADLYVIVEDLLLIVESLY